MSRKRPQRYTKTVHRRICEAVREGCYLGDAFGFAGIHRSTGFEWLRLGREHPAEHPDFARLVADVESEESAFVHEMHGHILGAARSREPQTWQAAMTILERRYPDRYGRRETTIIEGGESPLQVRTFATITDPATRELLREALRRLAAARPAAELDNGPPATPSD
ncbi:MAG: hypothetical protein ABR521_02715 [Gaiellaceae bacterium]